MRLQKKYKLFNYFTKWVIKPAIFIFFLFTAITFYLIHSPPDILIHHLVQTAEQVVKEETGLPLKIGQVKQVQLAIDEQKLILKDVQLYGYKGALEPAVIVPEVEVQLQALHYLTQRPHLNLITIRSPSVSLIRDKLGRLNIRPQTKPSKNNQSDPLDIELPQFHLKIKDASIRYQDQDKQYSLQSEMNIPEIIVQSNLRNEVVYRARAKSDLGNLNIHGTLKDAIRGKGNIQVQLDNSNINKIAKYATRVKGASLESGMLKANVKANWESYKFKRLLYDGNIHLNSFKANIPYYTLPLILNGDVSLNNKTIDIKELEALTNRSKVTLAGQIHDYDKPDNLKLDLNLLLHRLDIGSIVNHLDLKEITPLKKLKPRGVMTADLGITGKLPTPTVSGQIRIPQGNIMNINLNRAYTRLTYAKDNIDIHTLKTGILGGQITANGSIGLKGDGSLDTHIRASGITLASIFRDFKVKMTREYKPQGSFSLNATARGTLKSPRANGILTSSNIYFPNTRKLGSIRGVRANLNYSNTLSKVQLRANSTDFGGLNASATLHHNDRLKARFNLPNLPLRSVNNWTKEPLVDTGYIRAQANLSGSLKRLQKKWTAFNGNLSANGQNLAFKYPIKKALEPTKKDVKQNLEHIQLAVNWNQGQARIQSLELKQKNSNIKGSGNVNINNLLSKRTSTRAVDVKLDGTVNIEDFPVLKHYDIEKGQIRLTGEVNTINEGNLRVTVNTQGSDILAQGVKVASFDIETEFKDRLLKVNKAFIQQASSKLEMGGTVDMTKTDPVLNLNIKTEDLDAKTALSFIPAQYRQDNRPVIKGIQAISEQPAIIEITDEDLESTVWDLTGKRDKNTDFNPDDFGIAKSQALKAEALPPVLDTIHGKISMDLDVNGTLKHPDVNIQTVVTDGKIYDKNISEIYLNANYKNDKLNIKRFDVLEEQGGVIRVEGELSPKEEIELGLETRGINLALFNSFLKSSQSKLGGYLDFAAGLTGQTQSPKVVAGLEVHHALLNNIFFDHIRATSEMDQERIFKKTRIQLSYGDKYVVVFGDFPTNLNDSMDVTIKLDDESFGLINLFVNQLDWRKGKGAVMVHLTGPPKNPELDGKVEIKDAKIYLPSLQNSLTDFDAKVVLNTKQLSIEKMQAKYGQGHITVGGEMEVQDLLPAFYNLRVNMNDVNFKRKIKGRAPMNVDVVVKEAQIKIKGKRALPEIKGYLELADGQVNMPFLRQKRRTASVERLQTMADEKQSYIFGGLTVKIPEDFNVTSPLFEIPFTSKNGIRLKHRPKSGRMVLSLDGAVNANRGALYLLNTALNIEKMNVAFTKGATSEKLDIGTANAINPQIDLVASFKHKDADTPIRANFKGTLDSLTNPDKTPEFQFENPQGLSQTQILQALSGVDTIANLDSENILDVASKVSNAALKEIFNPLTSKLSRQLGLQELNFGLAGQSLSGPIFVVGVKASPFFFVKDQMQYLDKRLNRLKRLVNILNQVTISAGAEIEENNPQYKVGAKYNLTPNWGLEYEFDQKESWQRFQLSGSYRLQQFIDFLKEVDQRKPLIKQMR